MSAHFLGRSIPWTACGCEPRVSLDLDTYGQTSIAYCQEHAENAALREENARLRKVVEKSAPAMSEHPSYGPCDAFGPGDACSECKAIEMGGYTAAWETWLRSATVSDG